MIALFRYLMVEFLHSQRYLPPLLVFLGAVGIASPSTGALLPSYAIAAAFVLICGTWLTMALVHSEEPVQRGITTVTTGSARRVLAATVLVAMAGCAFLTIVGLLLPLVTGTQTGVSMAMLVGAAAQLACACIAIPLGLLCSRLIIRRLGYALVIALAAVMILLMAPWASPFHSLFTLMAHATEPAPVVVPAARALGVCAVTLLAGFYLILYLAKRRE